MRPPLRARSSCLHLGSGASMCAMESGTQRRRPRWALRQLTAYRWALERAPLIPGVVLYLMDQHNMDASAIEKLLYNQSGLLGVSGLSSDMRQLLASEIHGQSSRIDLYCYRIRREVGSLAAALGGLDAIVFYRRHWRKLGCYPRTSVPRRSVARR